MNERQPQKPVRRHDQRLDDTIADSFPASDPPSHSGVTGVGGGRGAQVPRSKSNRSSGDRAPSHERGHDARPTGHPNSDRHATETAHCWEDE